MKILLDECLPLDFRHSFRGHEAHTAQWAGLKGKDNGELLRADELAGYDVLLTVDQGIPQQQRKAGPRVAIVVIHARTNQMEDLLPLAGAISTAMQSIEPGHIVHVPNPA